MAPFPLRALTIKMEKDNEGGYVASKYFGSIIQMNPVHCGGIQFQLNSE
jgi:hypothetical protein